jgi:hypothetical protein
MLNVGHLDDIGQVEARLSDHINLPLDDFIEKLGKRTRRPFLRNFAGHQFKFVRLALLSAVAGANLNISARPLSELTTEDLRSLSKLLSRLEKNVVPELNDAIGLIGRMHDLQQIYQDLNFKPFRDLDDALIRLVLAIKEMAPTSRQIYAERRQTVGDIWRIAFAGGLFPAWRELTGGNPQPDGLFLEFVEAAWNTLSPDQPDVNFVSAIRTAKAKWKDSGPPAVSGPPPE